MDNTDRYDNWALALLLVATILATLSGCGVEAAAPPELPLTTVSLKPTTQSVKPVVVEGQGCILLQLGHALDCLPDTPDGCVCGIADSTNHATGSCHRGACCSGCWDNGDPEHGIPPQCWPGDGTAGLYGHAGSGCRITR